jgi:hypothetical protein
MQDSNHWPLFLVKRFHGNKYNIPHTEKLTCYASSEFQIGDCSSSVKDVGGMDVTKEFF